MNAIAKGASVRVACAKHSAIASLPGYQITEQLYTGTRTLVYRGIRTSDQQPVAIKLLRNEYPSFNELVQFRNQYTIAKNLDFPGIIKPLNLEVYGNSYALVMEDFGGISLSDYLKPATKESEIYKSLPLGDFLKIAIQLTETLHYLYQNCVIHKDIKPANILINSNTKKLKLIDFSISSQLPRETQEIENPNILEGTLAYLSPEQTGRMNRGIDYRSDFYSLGVTFYEILTGTLPYVSEDAMELVHCHLAKLPIPIHQINAEIPLNLSRIVSKLMSKNAEDRYQSTLGIKHDLEQCLTQLQTNGEIEDFELGQGDLRDRFTIPEKLYGRETEVNQLLNAFDQVANGTTEMMLVGGFSGIGKTAVVKEVHKPIARRRGYFIKGKYDQFQRNIPFSAFVEAFRDLIGQLLSESDAQLATWKTQILTALGDNGQVLIDVIPELEKIIGKQPPAPELSGTASQNRFNLLFQKFGQVFTSKEHPLVIFLDDLQWADSASLNLLKLLMEDSGYLLILGAYRDNEVSPVHPFILTVDELIKKGATINTITLPPLREADMNRLVADTLNCELSLAEPLTKLVSQKTQGNPFFATQFLKALHDDNLIKFIPPSALGKGESQGGWQCDITQVEALALTDDVVEFMALQLQKLPRETQEMLKLAACIGAQFDLNTLAIVSEKPWASTATNLWKALEEGLVIPTTKIYKFFAQSDSEEVFKASANPTYRFLHDRVQQAAYSLIPQYQKQKTHLKIGKLLLKNYQDLEREERLFDIVNQLNIGREFILGKTERNQLAELNLQAGRKAKAATAYGGALEYLTTGIELLSPESWQTEYDLTLALYTEAIASFYLNADFEQAEHYSTSVLERVDNLLDTVEIYQLKINQKIADQKADEALEIGLQILNFLGISRENILDYGKGETILPPVEDLANAPEMTDPYLLASMGLLMSLTSASTIAKPELLLPIIITQVHLSLAGGNSNLTAFCYGWYGSLLCGNLGEIDKGYHAGQIALELLERFNCTSIQCQVMTMVYLFVYPWKNSLRQVLHPALESFKLGLETGDILYGSYSIFNYCVYLFLSGHNLEDVVVQQSFYIQALQKQRLEYSVSLINFWKYLALRLKGESGDEIYKSLNDRINEVGAWGFYALYLVEGILLYLESDYTESAARFVQAKDYESAVGGWPVIGLHNFYDSLSLLALFNDVDPTVQEEYLTQVTVNQEKMRQWAENSPMNYLHKLQLVEAEKYRVLGNNYEAGDWYDRAIAGAKENEYIQEEALANELAAKFYLTWGREKLAATYMQEAYYCYARWGAKAKIAHLEQNYRQLLGAILQPAHLAVASGATLTMLRKSVNNTSSNENVWLDFPAVIKLSQAISQEIELEKLLASLMQIAIENAGAQRGHLILHHDEQWLVVVSVNQAETEKLKIPLEQYQEIPQSLIYSVARSQTTEVFDNLSSSEKFAGDRYITTHQPQSVLCTPIIRQGKLIGILYLENNLIVGAFTKDRLEILQLLTSQAAISLENAHLYQQVQNYSQTLEAEVERQTLSLNQKAQDLEQTLQKLQRTQAQLIHSEKMSSLGQLVAGIAHEINNPINFIHGNIIHTRSYLADLLDLLTLYQQEYPQPTPAIQGKNEEIDLNFLIEDLTKVLTSMQTGSDRIREIVQSLRNFSRLDEAEFKDVDIHSWIDSALLILQHRLNNDDPEREITIVKEYGQIPLVNCYPSALNQVFMNILNNAIDALQKTGKTSDEEGYKKPTIILRSFLDHSHNLVLSIADNGIGIEPSVINKIFDPFFTTKPVGSGTGLGLSISYSIIVEKHHGQLTCLSTPGDGTEFIIKLPI
jgi:predicted ATPase/signal transduction histidine kinase/tRNA A-37 threonylcarbamoyl transferase component Bud32